MIRYQAKSWLTKLADEGLVASFLEQMTKSIVDKGRNGSIGCISLITGSQTCDTCKE
jgi:hypothetical protein